MLDNLYFQKILLPVGVIAAVVVWAEDCNLQNIF